MTGAPSSAIDPVVSLMPATTEVLTGGRLSVGGVPLAEIVGEYGTPVYILDVAAFRQRARRFTQGLAERWPASEVIFASKAFPALVMYQLAALEGLSIDVAGDGELRLALAAGVDPSTIFFHGNAKTDAELRLASEAGVGTIVVDNEEELNRLSRLVDHTQDIMIRVIPGVDPDTHPSNATGGALSKFGLPVDQALQLMKRIERIPNVRMAGVHVHIGSQILDLQPFADAVTSIGRLGHQAAFDIGGGLGVQYTPNEHAPQIEEYLDRVTSTARLALPAEARLLIEPGRSLVAPTCVTAYRVVNVKRTGRSFVAVDGGMADNLDASITGRRHVAMIDGKVGQPKEGGYVVVGRQCESGDVLIDGIDLPSPEPGDVLVMPVTGAYSYTMANNYNGAYIPPIVCVEGGRTHLAARRQTFGDLFPLHDPLP